MKAKVADVIDEIHAIDHCLTMQAEIADRIRSKEILLDDAFFKSIETTRTFLYELKHRILRTEVEI